MEERSRVTDENESRLLAGIAHATAITQGIGILVAIIIYRHLREKSPRYAFQALQSAAYQLFSLGVVILSWMLWFVFYLLSFIPMMDLGPSDAPPPIFWVALGSMLIPFFIMVVLSIYGLVGAVKTWRGKEFSYALIGRLVEKNLSESVG